ncbi:MAG: cyclic nucleotide-binding domain-containing protein [Rhodospirillales bacterium]|nr:cyclic nucleotide-binding domain-containing protein [Rhodospirillales bacterium]
MAPNIVEFPLSQKRSASAMVESPCDDCAIREASVCSVLKQDELIRLRGISTIGHLESGGTVFHEGDPAEHLSNVIEGSVKLYKLLPDGRRQVTGFLFPGDFLGVALNETYAYSAEAMSKLRICRFPRRRLEGLLNELPKLEHRLLEVAGNEIVAAQDQMLLLGRKTARERVASFLLILRRHAEQRRQQLNPVDLPMSRADIGDYLGLTTETVSRTFTQLRKDGIIGLPAQGKVDIRRRDALENIAEGA